MNSETLTLEELTSRPGAVLASEPSLRNVRVTAETSDVRRAMHCYLELVRKNPSTGEPVAGCAPLSGARLLPGLTLISQPLPAAVLQAA